jgi:hypothetical protein
MNRKISFILCFVVVTCASRQDTIRQNLSFESLEVPYNFESVKIFQVSDFDSLTNPINKDQYIELFQDLATDRTTGDGEHTIPALIHSKEFLLTKHQIDKRYDFLTVLKEYENGKKIFWLSYHAKDSVFSLYGDSLRFTKGELTNQGILSKDFKNDSIHFRSYSTFLEQDKIKTTTIIHYNKESKIDSTINYIELLLHPYNDGFMGKAVGDQHYQNGILIYEIWEDDAEWTK